MFSMNFALILLKSEPALPVFDAVRKIGVQDTYKSGVVADKLYKRIGVIDLF